ncbi:MAG: carbohydrate ABC transporter permease, partial [Lawsonibacter sp.]
MITNNKVFIAIQYVFLFVLIVMAIIPFWLLISSSFTTEQEILENGYSLFPKVVTLDAYRYLFS